MIVSISTELLEVVDCSEIYNVMALLKLLSKNELEGTLPEEYVKEIFTPTVTATGVRVYAATNMSLVQGDLQFNFPSNMLQQAGEIGRAVQQECRDRSRMPSSA
eukprot:TRINITY_DN95763_c0_g1_i1.p1 TRINITY_DN95763_c0_g1~~TRINITY_DN95763_c0_g1_i1.p1  ORF type:complete len:104 (-),score=12.51 TRINITY_DN95763_c0_g1_i1:10-321(-)